MKKRLRICFMVVALIAMIMIITSCAEEMPKKYVLFTLNTHEWVFDEKSAATVQKVVEIHEKYNVPIAVYLTDPMVQRYAETYPALIKLLKTSPVVVVSYHIRAPMPHYPNFDFLGLSEMSEEALYETLRAYEEHALNLVTGMPTEEEGGYEGLKKVMGYAPPIVGMQNSGNTIIGKTLSKIYAEKGATFAVVHGKNPRLGDKTGSLLSRPEDVEIKLYEYASLGKNSKTIIAMESVNASTTSDIFINIKMHDSDFYARQLPQVSIYYEKDGKGKPRTPPFDLSLAGGEEILQTEEEQQEQWRLYEEMVKYISEHQEEFTSMSEFDLVKMVQ